jgi:hypothetical protein
VGTSIFFFGAEKLSFSTAIDFCKEIYIGHSNIKTMSPQLEPTGVNAENGWIEFFEKAFDALKVKFREIHPFDEDGEVSPNILALRDAIFKLPCPVRVIELRFDETKFTHVKDGIGHLLRYDLSRMDEKQIEDYGVVNVENREALKAVLIDKFGFSESDITSFISDFKTVGMWDGENSDYYIHFAHYDIRRNFDEYLHELLMIFLYNLGTHLIQKFKKEFDFNALYDLKEDKVFPFEEIVKKEPILDNLSGKPTIEDLQKGICAIQLIPTVPEEVQRIFKAAKDLYVFGFFRYYFFTISQHYTYLAIESAIRHRYNQWLGEKAVLTCNYKKKNLRHEMFNPTYHGIFDFCRQNKYKNQGWNYHKLKVNGEAFPWKMDLLLNWLVEKNIQTKWQRNRLKLAIYLRNSLSHLEFVSISFPTTTVLELGAESINNLYHQNA